MTKELTPVHIVQFIGPIFSFCFHMLNKIHLKTKTKICGTVQQCCIKAQPLRDNNNKKNKKKQKSTFVSLSICLSFVLNLLDSSLAEERPQRPSAVDISGCSAAHLQAEWYKW